MHLGGNILARDIIVSFLFLWSAEDIFPLLSLTDTHTHIYIPTAASLPGIMGLSFRDSLEEEDEYLPYLTEARRSAGVNPRAKHGRRPFHWNQWKSYVRHYHAIDPEPHRRHYADIRGYQRTDTRPHWTALASANLSHHRNPHYVDKAWDGLRHKRAVTAQRRVWRGLADDGEVLARSADVELPGTRRPPSLERQDAFRDTRGVKRRRSMDDYSGDNNIAAPEHTGGRADEKAELYRLGLLYDDEHERGSEFTLDTIVHQGDPLWNVNFRVAKQNRGRRRRGSRRTEHQVELGLAKGDSLRGQQGRELSPLDLALSFAVLSEDEAVAAFLMSPGSVSTTGGTYQNQDAMTTSTPEYHQPRRLAPLLKVFYELKEDTDGALTRAEAEANPDLEMTPMYEEVTMDDIVEELGDSPCLAGGLDGQACSECLSYSSDEEWAYVDNGDGAAGSESTARGRNRRGNGVEGIPHRRGSDADAWVVLDSDGS